MGLLSCVRGLGYADVSMSCLWSGLMVGVSRVWLSAGLVLSLTTALLMGLPSQAGAVAGYGDVPESTWYTDAVQWSVDNAITGISGACFAPETPVSRGETAVWIHNMENQPDAEDPHSFIDVTNDAQDDAISWMANTGITTGTTPTTFAPDETLRRAQAAAFLHRLADEPSAPPHGFSDVVSGWQQESVSWMSHTGITTGTSPTAFAPEDTLTRAQLITFLYRYKGEPNVTLNASTPICDPTTDMTKDPADTPTTSFKALSSGGFHSCGIRSDDTVVCWGNNSAGQATAPEGRFKTVSAGTFHNCGIRNNNTTVCWGNNSAGQATAPTGSLKTVSAGTDHSCGIRNNNTVICWGNNSQDQATAPAGSFKTASAGAFHSCGIRNDDTIICWGNNQYGRTTAPTGSFKTVTAGASHSCGIRNDDTAVCWGNNWDGLATAPTGNFKTVSAGAIYSCGIRNDNTAVCWGNNWDGQTTAPTGSFKTVSAGGAHSCGIRNDNSVVCWGSNWEVLATAPTP